MINRGNFNPASFLSPAAPIQILYINQFSEYLKLINNSPYQLAVNLDGSIVNVSDFRVKDILLNGIVRSVTIIPSINISTVPHSQSSLLIVEEYDKGEITVPVDDAIPQQAVTATASGKPLFTATAAFFSTATLVQVLNIFNPTNSGVTFTFHSASAFTTDVTNPEVDLIYDIGADLNLATPKNAVSHSGQSNPPVSFAHVTAVDNASGLPVTSVLWSTNLQAAVEKDLLAFPDNATLAPGGNIYLSIVGGATGKLVRLTFKWSEDIAVPQQGGIPTGIILTSIVNNNNPAPTPVVTGTPSGDGAPATLINNDGTISLGNSSRIGKVSMPNSTGALQVVLESDGVGNIILGTPELAKLIRFFLNPAGGGPHLADLGASGLDLSPLTAVTSNLLKLLTNGMTRIQIAGPYNVTNTATFFNHNLGDVPSFAIPFLGGTIGAVHAVSADQTTMTSTQVKMSSDSAGGVNAFVVTVKF